MKKIKRLLTIGLAVLLTLCMSVSFSSCISFYCDPKGKDWYNSISLPCISSPFNEIYDGSYSIRIDEDGGVVFKPLDGEEIKGTLTTSLNPRNTRTNVDIAFENGKTAWGYCYTRNKGRSLTIIDDNRSYVFTDKRQLSKEEFEIYRNQFIAFLSNVYETGLFPTREEIENNSLYKKFTNYYQIDPGHGGPIHYETLERVTIEKIETVEKYGKISKEITVNIDGESVVCQLELMNVVRVKNGELQALSENDIMEGDCLIVRQGYWNGLEGKEEYRIFGIFYLENN